DESSTVLLRYARLLAPGLAGSASLWRSRTSRTSPATHCADEPYVARAATTRSRTARLDSTAKRLVVNHSPALSPAAHSVFVSACAPTDVGATTRLADPRVPSMAARSTESGFLPAAVGSGPHLADHVSVSVVRPLESSPDGQPGNRSPAPPSGSETIASFPLLQFLHAPALAASNKTPSRHCHCVPTSFPSPPRSLYRAPPVFAGERANRIL